MHLDLECGSTECIQSSSFDSYHCARIPSTVLINISYACVNCVMACAVLIRTVLNNLNGKSLPPGSEEEIKLKLF